jgi:hypothetical protein
MDIAKILGADFLEKFRYIPRETLFPPNWDALLEKRCPLCGNKLRTPIRRNQSIMFCNGKAHKKPFIINKARLDSIYVSYHDGLPMG